MAHTTSGRMALVRAAVAACIGFMVPNMSLAEEMKSEAVYQKALPSVVTLKVQTRNDLNVVGTAFLALRDGVGITAWHVVQDARAVTAKFADGEEFDVSGLIDRDEKRDLAAIRIKVAGRKLLSLASAEPAVGSKAYVMGSPKGLDFSVSDGLVSQIQMVDTVKYYQFSCAASPGNSGGPLVSATGDVLGVVSWQVRDGQNLNFAIPYTYVLGLDLTLPTQPWEQVKATPLPKTPASTTSDDEIDKLLAQCIQLDMDSATAAICAADLLSRPVYKDGLLGKRKYRLPDVPPCIYSMQEMITRTSKKIGDAKTEDRRARLLDYFRRRFALLSDVMDKYTKLIRMIQAQAGWTAESRDLQSQISAKQNVEPVTEEDWGFITKLKTVRDSLPLDVQIMIGAVKDEAGYALGVQMFTTSPLLIQVVHKDSVAEQIGFRPGDTVVSVDGNQAKAWQDVKLAVKAKLGQKCRIAIIREGKERVLEPRLPSELPKTAVYSEAPR